jgi:hypothetical protein
MKFVATKTADQLDLQALHRVRERFVSQRTGVNQNRAFLLERLSGPQRTRALIAASRNTVSAAPTTDREPFSRRGARIIERHTKNSTQNIAPGRVAGPVREDRPLFRWAWLCETLV